MSEAVAIIGMGQMGAAMGRRLKESGHLVGGYDISGSVRAALAESGFRMAGSIGEAVSKADIILSSLPDPSAVREAWLGSDGIVAHARAGTLCIELSTIDPDTMREVAQAAVGGGLDVIDCPVSGSPKEAATGKLILIAGGDPKAFGRAKPILDLLGSDCKYTGAVGTAKVVKMVNNMMSMSNVLAAAEAFALGTAAGVEPDVLFEVLAVSGGRSHHFTKRFPNALKGDFAPGFKIELGEKDLALGIDLGRRLNLPTPVASTVRGLFSIALAEGFRGKDIVAVLAMYQGWIRQ
jgi:3-hydroxyisobutyrate dehydrogenase-like beta-hydroxyacid dehydrogenase